MMKTTRKRLLGGALAFVAALALCVGAMGRQDGGRGPGGPGGRGRRGPGGPGGRGFGGPLGPLARDLNLTDAQKAEVKKITDAFEASTKSIHEQLRAAGGPGGPFEGLKDGAFDEAAVRSAAQARAALHVELEVAHARMLSQVYALLTAEQKATLAERRQQFEQRRRQHKAEEAPAAN